MKAPRGTRRPAGRIPFVLRPPVLKPPVWEWKIPAYLFTGGLAAASALLAAGADLTGRPASAPGGRPGQLPGAAGQPGSARRRPGPAGTVPSHAAGGQAHLADECRHLDPHRVTGPARGAAARRTAARGAAAPLDRPAAGLAGRPAGLCAAVRLRGWRPTRRRCCPRPRSRPGARPTRACRSCSPGRRRPAGRAGHGAARCRGGPARRLAVAGAAGGDGRLVPDRPRAGLSAEAYTTGQAAPAAPVVGGAHLSAVRRWAVTAARRSRPAARWPGGPAGRQRAAAVRGVRSRRGVHQGPEVSSWSRSAPDWMRAARPAATTGPAG